MIETVQKALLRRSMLEAKLIYFGYILLSIIIAWSLLDSFFSYPKFGSFLTFTIVGAGLFFFYLKVLKIAYLNSTSLITLNTKST